MKAFQLGHAALEDVKNRAELNQVSQAVAMVYILILV